MRVPSCSLVSSVVEDRITAKDTKVHEETSYVTQYSQITHFREERQRIHG